MRIFLKMQTMAAAASVVFSAITTTTVQVKYSTVFLRAQITAATTTVVLTEVQFRKVNT